MDSSFDVRVKVVAGSKTEGLEKLGSQSFKIKVRVAPERGKANERVAEMLAEYFAVSKSQVALKSGRMARDKIFTIRE